MPELDAEDELRSLQQRAYGRGGGLTEAEAARLRELEDQGSASPTAAQEAGAAARDVRSAGEAGGPTGDVPETGGAEDERSAAPRESEATERPAERALPRPHATGAVEALRRHGKAAAAASALLLVIGIGAGWALFSPRQHDAVSLTADEVERKLELDEKSKFDEGSLRAVARDDDALVWFGTMRDGDQSCIVLDAAGQSQTGCSEAGDISLFGLTASISLPPEDDATEDDFGSTISAYAMISTTGEPMVAVQRWNSDASMLEQFDEEERERVDALVKDEGFFPSVSLVGYIDDQPVWLADRLADAGKIEKCVIADALDVIGCGESETVLEEGVSVGGIDTDGRPVDASVQFTNWGTPYLTVTRAMETTTVIETGEFGATPSTDPQG